MKKTLTTIVTLLLVVCTLLVATACGNGNGGLDYNKAEDVLDLYGFSQKDKVEESEIEAFLTLAEQNESPTYPNLNDGATICFRWKSDLSYGGGKMKMENFVMNVKSTDNGLIAEGAFKMTITLIGQEQVASVKFYHDGTYFGMEIKQDGYETDRQKKEMPLWTSLNNFMGKENYFEESMALMPKNVAEIREINENNYKEDLADLQCFMRDRNNGGKQIDYKLFNILFDESYNIVACNNDRITMQVFDGEINMPSDYDSWSVR